PGPGQVRALVTFAGNPALSAPDSGHLETALASLDFMLSVDCYINETTCHADVILPSPSPLSRGHYDLAFWHVSLRNVANYSPPRARAFARRDAAHRPLPAHPRPTAGPSPRRRPRASRAPATRGPADSVGHGRAGSAAHRRRRGPTRGIARPPGRGPVRACRA